MSAPRPLTEDNRVSTLKQQVAVVRALADELERCLARDRAAIGEQFVDELARLGCASLATALAMGRSTEPSASDEAPCGPPIASGPNA